jgi:hypothetical protein
VSELEVKEVKNPNYAKEYEPFHVKNPRDIHRMDLVNQYSIFSGIYLHEIYHALSVV